MTAGVPACQGSATESCDGNSVGQASDGSTDHAGQLHTLKLSQPSNQDAQNICIKGSLQVASTWLLDNDGLSCALNSLSNEATRCIVFPAGN